MDSQSQDSIGVIKTLSLVESEELEAGTSRLVLVDASLVFVELALELG